jgi:mannose-6-phosphate isomerase-like protein (cupin superfamily)
MRIDERLLEIKEYTGEGYKPVIDYEAWRVAILNYCEELLPENITKMQKHDESDEVFVVLKGEFTLYIGEGKDKIDNIYAQKLEPLKMYNVKKGVWHTHTLSKDAMVLIVENKNTDLSNSPEKNLTSEQRSKLINCIEQL